MDYYAALPKSPLTPPPWVFRVVWPALYASMVAALGLYLRAGGRVAWDDSGLRLFAAQLALNLAWSPVFFWLRRPNLALVIACALLATAAACAASFARASPTAAALLGPYLAWLAFAVYLNAHIVRSLAKRD